MDRLSKPSQAALVPLLFWAATSPQVPALIGAPGGRALACFFGSRRVFVQLISWGAELLCSLFCGSQSLFQGILGLAESFSVYFGCRGVFFR